MNIVFDLGGVVLTWEPDRIIAGVFDDPDVQNLVLREVFQHQDWLELDRGTLERDRAIERAVVRTDLSKDEVSRLMLQVPDGLRLKPDTLALVRRVKAAGHRVFCLSNMHAASMAHLEETYDFWDVFDGLVISCRVYMIKPEPEIYQHLLERFDLVPGETVFVDDLETNVQAASEQGIQTIRFESPEQCEVELKALGCL